MKFQGCALLLQATCFLSLVAGNPPELTVLSSRVFRGNVEGLQPGVTPEPCNTRPWDRCARYPDPWQGCDTGRAGTGKMEALADSLTRFGLTAYTTIAKYNNDANVIISPVSLAAALTHLLLGAKNETQRDLEEALFYTRDNGCVHQAFKELLKRTHSLQSASQLFFRQGTCLQESFMQRSKRFYGYEPMALSMNASENVRYINSWVAENTGGKIKKLLDSVPGDTILMLLNAVYFNGTWKAKFNKEETKSESFWVTPDRMVMVPMLQQGTYPLAALYLQDLNIKVAKLQMFGKNSLIVIVPQDSRQSLAKIEQTLSVDRLTRIIGELQETDFKPTSIMLPKLNLNFKQDLLLPLNDMGLEGVLVQPNLCGMSAHQRMEISGAEHHAVLTLGEEGVEAAAVTTLSVARNVLVFEVQRPFLLLVWNDDLGFPLFVGRVVDPSQ
ncbi:plasma protease C1 inhibitor-like [Cetorhinus maximus]